MSRFFCSKKQVQPTEEYCNLIFFQAYGSNFQQLWFENIESLLQNGKQNGTNDEIAGSYFPLYE